jgi:transposase
MSMYPQLFYLIPAETERVARAAFPKASAIMRIRDELGMLFADHDFATLFSEVGQPALSPSRLMLITIFQFLEGLTDRQAADAVRRCIDWKYALALDLTDPGFDFSVLSEFRDRLLMAETQQAPLNHLLSVCREKGLVKARGKQRTDATHVLAAIRTLNRLECLGETLAHTLHQLLRDAPTWASASIPPEWWERYAQRFDAFRLPATKPKQTALALQIGRDGRHLLGLAQASTTPAAVQAHPAVALLRQVWIQQFYADTKPTAVRLRTVADLPPAARLIGSPYDADARLSTKRDTTWNGYKVHLTESCDADTPNLITDVQTTVATTPDGQLTRPIQAALAARQLLPAEQYVDCAYTDAATIIDSQTSHAIELVGPVQRDGSWQAQADQGFGAACFAVDWESKQVVCPQGQTSRVWSASTDTAGQAVIHIQFERSACAGCAVRAACTKAKTGRRTLKLRPQAQYAALQAARQYQETEAFKQRYRVRAGVEGTLNQGVQAFELRYARYRGLPKTSLQHILTVLAINLTRLVAWWEARPKAQTRSSRFAAGMRRAAAAACSGT